MSIKRLLDRPIAFHRSLVPVAGSVAAAVMLSQAIYWSNRTSDPDGWFWKTASEWEEETGLSTQEQRTARTKMRKAGFWEEKKQGVPAKLYYRIDFNKLECCLQQSSLLVATNCDVGSNKLSIYTESTPESTSSPAQSAGRETPDTEDVPEPAAQQQQRPKRKRTDRDDLIDAVTEAVHGHADFDLVQGRTKKTILNAVDRMRDKGFTAADVADWYQNKWRKEWPGKNGDSPSPDKIVSGIGWVRGAARQETEEPDDELLEGMKLLQKYGAA